MHVGRKQCEKHAFQRGKLAWAIKSATPEIIEFCAVISLLAPILTKSSAILLSSCAHDAKILDVSSVAPESQT
jgi:hypothetical protein